MLAAFPLFPANPLACLLVSSLNISDIGPPIAKLDSFQQQSLAITEEEK